MTATFEAHAHTYITHTDQGACYHEHCSLSPARGASLMVLVKRSLLLTINIHCITSNVVMHNIQVFNFQNLHSCVPTIATID